MAPVSVLTEHKSIAASHQSMSEQTTATISHCSNWIACKNKSMELGNGEDEKCGRCRYTYIWLPDLTSSYEVI